MEALSRVGQGLKGKAVRDFILTAGSNLSITLLGAVSGVLAARLLGPEGRGVLAAAIVWANILSGIAQVGLPQALTYITAREPGAVGSIFYTTIVLLLVQSVVILFVGWSAVNVWLASAQPVAADAVRVYLISIPCSLLITYLITIAQGLKRFVLFNMLRIVSSAGYFVVLVAAGILGLHQASAIVAMLVGIQLIAAFVGLGWFIVLIQPSGRFSWRQVGQLLGYGLKAYWGNLSWMTNARLDQFIMSAIIGLDQLGHYAVAVSYAMVLFPLSSAFAMVLFPRVAEGERGKAKSTIEYILKLNFILSGVGALALALLAPAVLPWLFGVEFRPSIVPAVILLGGTVFLGSNYVLSDGLRGLGSPLAVSVAEIAGSFVTVVGLVFLLPRLGIRGAAWVSLLSYAMVFLVLLVRFRRQGNELPSIEPEPLSSLSELDS